MKYFLSMVSLLLWISVSAQAEITSIIYQDCNKNGIKEDYAKSGTTNGHEWVDLGLSVYWATSSLDGEYAWGETTTKSQYTWETYSMSGSTWEHMYKYSDWDGKIQLEASDDVATQKWGNGWHIPTKTEWDELMACQHTNNGGKYSFTNNDITLSINSVDHWSSTRNNTYDYMAYHFRAVTNNITVYSRYHEMMIRPVCVKSSVEKYTIIVMSSNCIEYNTYKFNKSAVTQISAVPNTGYHFVKWNDGNTSNPRTVTVTKDSTFTAVFAPNSCTISTLATNGTITGGGTYNYGDTVTLITTPNEGYQFEKWLDGNTNNPRSVVVTQDSTFTATFAPNQYTLTTIATCGKITGGGIYSLGDTATLFVTPDEGCHFTQWSDGNTDNPRQVIVNKDSTFIAEFSVEAAGDVEYVDLGLSVLWATCNLGATKPTEAGYYYAWGELEPKKVYNWETYKFWAGKYSNVTKYVHSSQYGDVDNKTQLEYIDDAARYKYGKGWHIPTKQECQELVDSCVWTRIVDGTNGYVVTSLINGKSIFLPVTGYYIDTLLYSMSNGYFISSSINTRHPLFYGVEYEWKYDRYQTYSSCNRQYGYPIRPVCDKHVLMYNVQVLSEYGSASGSGQYSEGSIAQLSASTEDSCYVFVQWSDGNTDNPRKLVVTQDTTLTAEFDQIKYNITLDSDAERGEVVEE